MLDAYSYYPFPSDKEIKTYLMQKTCSEYPDLDTTIIETIVDAQVEIMDKKGSYTLWCTFIAPKVYEEIKVEIQIRLGQDL
jgi:hypothetical protein